MRSDAFAEKQCCGAEELEQRESGKAREPEDSSGSVSRVGDRVGSGMRSWARSDAEELCAE